MWLEKAIIYECYHWNSIAINRAFCDGGDVSGWGNTSCIMSGPAGGSSLTRAGEHAGTMILGRGAAAEMAQSGP